MGIKRLGKEPHFKGTRRNWGGNVVLKAFIWSPNFRIEGGYLKEGGLKGGAPFAGVGGVFFLFPEILTDTVGAQGHLGAFWGCFK